MKKNIFLFSKKAEDWTLGFSTLVLAATFFLGMIPLIQRMFCPVQIQQTEAYMVDRALLFFTGETLYPDPSRGGPYILTAYPPFYFFLQAVLLKITGGLWQAGRFLSMGGYLGCGFLLLGWGWRRWGKVPAAAAALLFWLSPTWALWGSIVRPDTPALFFHFAAFILLFRDAPGKKTEKTEAWGLVGAGLLSGAAVCIKQTTVSLWLAFGLYSLFKSEWRKFGFFLLGCLPPVLTMVLWEQGSTHGMYLRHTGPWLDTGYNFKTLEYFFIHGFLKEAFWLVGAVIFTLLFKAPGLMLKCQIFFSALQLLLLGRNGGAENYCLEFWLYGIFLAAEGNVDLFVGAKGNGMKWAPTFLILGVYSSLVQCAWPSAPSADAIQMKREAARMYLASGPYLALDMDLPLMAGKRIWYQPVEFQYLFVKDRWKAEPLLKDIKLKRFTSIELYDLPEQYLMPKPLVAEIEADYQVSLTAWGRRWYVPR